MKRILEGAGFEVNVLFGPQSKGVSEWKSIPKAAFNLIVSPWIGLETAEYLKEKYHQPYLHIPIIPIGEEATAAFIRQVVEFAGIDNQKAEKFITNEANEYYYYLEHFSEFFAEYWFGLPAKFITVGDSAYNIALTKFLADQIGMIPVKQIITDDPPEKYRNSISALYHKLTENIGTEPEYLEDGYLIERVVKETDIGQGVPLILGSHWEKEATEDLNGILLQVGMPVSSEVVIHRSYVGYKGALTLLEQIYSAAVKHS